MEKINKEELMKKLNLTEEELEKVAGGSSEKFDFACFSMCVLEGLSDLECYEWCNKNAAIPRISDD